MIKTRSRYQSSINNLLKLFRKKHPPVRHHARVGLPVPASAAGSTERERRRSTAIQQPCRLACLWQKECASFHTTPCSDVGKLNERRDRRQARPLSYEEEDRVKQFSPPLLRMLITLLAETGLRVKKEALPLRWSDVSLDSEPACIRILDSKSAAGLRLGMADNALSQRSSSVGVNCLVQRSSPFVFPSPRNPTSPLC